MIVDDDDDDDDEDDDSRNARSQFLFCKILKNQWYHAEEVSFEWSHHRISLT